MKIHVLFMQRQERYQGEFGPEALVAIDEFCLDENPDNWAEQVAKAKAAHKDVSAGFAEVAISVDGDEIRRRCLNEQPALKGKIE